MASLYPTVDRDDLNLDYTMGQHKVMIRTLNLNQDWKKIRQDMIDLLEKSMN
jgi:hypothetical protein